MNQHQNQHHESISHYFQDHGILDCVIEALKKSPSLAEKKGVTKNQLASLYALGFDLYEMQYFKMAADTFRLLCFYDPKNSRNWLALGGAYQHTKNHNNALAAFAMAAVYDTLNPEPMFYSAHSFIDLMDLPLALECAETAVKLSTDRPDKKSIFRQATALRDALVAQLKLT